MFIKTSLSKSWRLDWSLMTNHNSCVYMFCVYIETKIISRTHFYFSFFTLGETNSNVDIYMIFCQYNIM